jgi:hypothetical protein
VVVQFSKVFRHEGLSFCPRGFVENIFFIGLGVWYLLFCVSERKKMQKLNLMCNYVAFENCLDYFL